MNVPTIEELKQALQIPEITPEYDRAGRTKPISNRPIYLKRYKDAQEWEHPSENS
jgi:hypothetical protein